MVVFSEAIGRIGGEQSRAFTAQSSFSKNHFIAKNLVELFDVPFCPRKLFPRMFFPRFFKMLCLHPSKSRVSAFSMFEGCTRVLLKEIMIKRVRWLMVQRKETVLIRARNKRWAGIIPYRTAFCPMGWIKAETSPVH